jgi:hypothetical protein
VAELQQPPLGEDIGVGVGGGGVDADGIGGELINADGLAVALGKLQANVLKFPHHGAWPTTYPAVSQFEHVPRRTMADFLAAVAPQYVILSVGHDNTHGHVRQEVFDALLAIPSGNLRRILCTQITPTCLAAGAACPSHQCAGDVEIRIGGAAHGGIEVLPQGTAHRRTITTITTLPDARCSPLL